MPFLSALVFGLTTLVVAALERFSYSPTKRRIHSAINILQVVFLLLPFSSNSAHLRSRHSSASTSAHRSHTTQANRNTSWTHTQTQRVLALTKRHVGSGNEIDTNNKSHQQNKFNQTRFNKMKIGNRKLSH